MKHFRRNELACKCGCGQDTVDFELAEVLDDLRDHFGRKVFVTSGNRCKAYNAKVGGVDGSYHLRSKAADIVVEGVEPIHAYTYLASKYLRKYGIGSYETFTHIDVSPEKRRW